VSRHPQSGLIHLVDGDPEVRARHEEWLREAGYTVVCHASGVSCLAAIAQRAWQPGVILIDLDASSAAHDVLTEIHTQRPDVPVVVIGANRDVDGLVRATRLGAFDYLFKPIDRERLLATTANAIEPHPLARRLVPGLAGQLGMIGRSPAMQNLAWQIHRVAAKDVSVLIHGESGTGKELVAQAIHALSGRRHARFLAINCAAIPETLQDTELFGHERGSFTGAAARHQGRFEQVAGGTLFLDEVAELSPAAQSRLLRVLQERTLRRVGGGPEELPVDFRLVAASHRHLWSEVEAGRFREDLYFRIVVFEIGVPALRERAGDVALLSDSFLERYGPSIVGEVPKLSAEALAVLESYGWPGNVRQLQNALQRAIVSCSGGQIRPSDLPSALLARTTSAPALRAVAAPRASSTDLVLSPGERLVDIERRVMQWALDRANGNLSLAARELGVARTTLYRKLVVPRAVEVVPDSAE
jgi:two-component system, NtrC family, response regulator HydG